MHATAAVPPVIFNTEITAQQTEKRCTCLCYAAAICLWIFPAAGINYYCCCYGLREGVAVKSNKSSIENRVYIL